MALATIAAGRYTATYAAAALGLTRRGYELDVQHLEDMVQETDGYGSMIIDGIYRGMNASMDTVFLEWVAGVLTALFPWDAVPATGAGGLTPGIIGRLSSDVGGALVLSDVTGTPADNKPATLTAPKAKTMENFPVRINFDSSHRIIPWRARFLPDDSVNLFTVT